MSKTFGFGAVALACVAGMAMANPNSINSISFNTYESFRNPSAVIPSTLNVNGSVQAASYNGTIPIAGLGALNVREQYSAGTGGFANRHIAWLSNDGGATPYQITGTDSFQVRSCFTMTTNHPTGVSAPINSEAGFWIHNPRVNEQGNSFIDEGGVWLISNGTSFVGGASQDFFLFGEGGFNNPSSPPIFFPGDVMEVSYTYYAPEALGPGQRARFEASVSNVTRGISVSSGLKNFNAIAGSNENGLNAGATMGFRFQNQVFPLIDTDTSTQVFNISVVPAPASAVLMGLAGLVATRRRR